MKTDCNPNRLRKYHDRLDTHCTSRSWVATPDCNIDLNLKVKGNGSLTVRNPVSIPTSKSATLAEHVPSQGSNIRLTDYKPRKEGLDPPHDQRLRNHHHHVPFHHPHHPLHGCGICHRIPGRLPSLLGLFEKFTLLVAIDKIVSFYVEGGGADGGVV